jgi:excisionase family DNA binding protein
MPKHTSKMLPADKHALRIDESVAFSGIGRSTLYKLFSAGKLTSVRVGGRRLIRRADLEALLRTGTNIYPTAAHEAVEARR